MTLDLTQILVAVLAFLGAGGALGAWVGRRKTDAEAELTMGEGWQKLLGAQQDQIDRLRAEVDELRAGRRACEAELAELRQKVARLEGVAAGKALQPPPKTLRPKRVGDA